MGSVPEEPRAPGRKGAVRPGRRMGLRPACFRARVLLLCSRPVSALLALPSGRQVPKGQRTAAMLDGS